MQHRGMGGRDRRFPGREPGLDHRAPIGRIGSNGVAASNSTCASSLQLFGDLLRLDVEVFVDVAERPPGLVHQRDAAADQAEPHAGLQQHEPGADALDVGVARIGQHQRVGDDASRI